MTETADLRKLAIVPAYNEADMVARVVRDIRREAPGFDVVVIDDGSVDATAAEAEREGADVIRHPFNLGIGGAMQSGYQYALRHGYDVAVQVDGDGQHKPDYLHDMLGDAADRRRRGRHGLRQPLPRRPRLQGAAGAADRQPDLLGRAHRRSRASASPTRPRASG